jgi:tripartite-type tricarboxylate transporter receptor subunit TctC
MAHAVLNMLRIWAARGLLALLGITFALPVHAQYPSRPVRIVVASTPGATVDILARAISPALQQAFGQPIVVENRAGAGGNIGAEFVAKSAPDGYTLLMATNAPLTINVALNPVKYDTLRDFSPVIVLSTSSSLLSVNTKLPAKSIREFIDLAKAKPTELSVATSGIGTGSHLALLEFNRFARVRTTTVPHRGGAESTLAAVAGDVHAVFSDIVPALPLIREGRLCALATTGARRSLITPEIPTLGESGLKGLEVSLWTGVFAPAKVPADILERVNREIDAALKNRALWDKLIAAGIEPVGSSLPEAQAHLQREVPRWKAILEAAGLGVK